MIPELGLLCLILACALAFVQVARPGNALPQMQLFLLFVALAALIVSRITDDFTVQNVAEHSNRTLPLLYKITGAWGNHEGSLILIVMVLAAYAARFARSPAATEPYGRTALAVQGAFTAAFLLFILFAANPFARSFPPAEDGAALNPLLQDVALAIHPPLLYMGYMGFSLVFSLATGALMEGRLTREWAHTAQPWILAAWSFLTLGIALGSWWAYRELGWGGYWFWDPVENASLLPWLSGTALLHANKVLMKRGQLKHWVLLLCILTFAMSLFGAFLVRSGIITSVHSFASDPTRGVLILGFLALSVGAALALYAARAARIESESVAAPLSREGLMLAGSALFSLMLGIVLLGTLYPILAQWWGRSLHVGAPYFNRTALPVMAMALLLAGIGPLAAWQRDTSKRLIAKLRYPLLAVLAAVFLALAFAERGLAAAALGLGLAAWLASASFKTWKNHPPSACAHVGAAVLAAGVTGMAAWQVHLEKTLKPGQEITLGAQSFKLERIETQRRPNHTAHRATVSAGSATLTPEYRLYDIRRMGTSEAAIDMRWWGDVYVVAGEAGRDGMPLKFYINPLSHLLWIGAGLMALGGALAIFPPRKGHA